MAPSCFDAFAKKVWIVGVLNARGRTEARMEHSVVVMPKTLIVGSGSRVSTASSKGSSSEDVQSLMALTESREPCECACWVVAGTLVDR